MNEQAFGVAKFGRAHRQIQRNLDLSHRKEHVPIVNRTDPDSAPPMVVTVMGPPKSGKTTLIKVRIWVNYWLVLYCQVTPLVYTI